MSFVIIKKGEIVGLKAHHSSFDDDQLCRIYIQATQTLEGGE